MKPKQAGERATTPALDKVAKQFFQRKRAYVRAGETVDAYESNYAHHIQPTLGAYPIGTITPYDVDDWVEAMVTGRIKNARTGAPLNPKTIRSRHALLHSIMEYAASPRRRIIDVNPCKGKAELPKKVKAVPKGMRPAQWQALHANLMGVCEVDAADLAEFLLGSGWRVGEGMAVAVGAVEDYGPGAPMWVTMDRVVRGKTATYIAEADGKAQKSMRRIKLDPQTAAMVRRRCEGKKVTDLVFTRDGEMWEYHRFRQALERVRDASGVPRLTTHWFRHTHVAWLAMSGAPLPELQSRIGHASITTTIGVYGSMIGDVQTASLDAFSRMRDSGPGVAETLPPNVIEGSTVTS